MGPMLLSRLQSRGIVINKDGLHLIALSVDSIAVNHIKKLLQIQLNLSIMN